jgi:hypothetical protein
MRSILILYGRAALAACLVFVALSCPGHADNYGIARAEFNRLPIDQRYETQVLLGVAGYWPAVANDEFNHRFFEAITHFQADNGFPVSGISTAAQIDRARQIADPILAYWQLKPVRHPIAGCRFGFPLEWGSIKFERGPVLILKPQTRSRRFPSISFLMATFAQHIHIY